MHRFGVSRDGAGRAGIGRQLVLLAEAVELHVFLAFGGLLVQSLGVLGLALKDHLG